MMDWKQIVQTRAKHVPEKEMQSLLLFTLKDMICVFAAGAFQDSFKGPDATEAYEVYINCVADLQRNPAL